MEIQPNKQNLNETFSNKVYFIDFYQRDYKWTEEPVKRLLDDVFYQFDEAYAKHADLDPNKENINARYPWYYLNTYDQAAKWRDAGRCVISGFHSQVEKECLRILLRGSQPIIICPARALPKRIPPEWRKPLANDRLLILSFFPQTETRITADLAARRNELVAALADEVYVAHATPGGRLESTLRQKPLPLATPIYSA